MLSSSYRRDLFCRQTAHVGRWRRRADQTTRCLAFPLERVISVLGVGLCFNRDSSRSQGQQLFNHRTKPVRLETHTQNSVCWLPNLSSYAPLGYGAKSGPILFLNLEFELQLLLWIFFLFEIYSYTVFPVRAHILFIVTFCSYSRDAAGRCPSWWSPLTGRLSANGRCWSPAAPRPQLASPPSWAPKSFMHSGLWRSERGGWHYQLINPYKLQFAKSTIAPDKNWTDVALDL